MSPSLPRVYNIAPGGDFLEVLAHHILNGFPFESDSTRIPLSRWTIFLPTRRAANQLRLILLGASGQRALLLPRIKPIGDLDENLTPDFEAETILPPSMSPTGQFFALLSLLDQWANENPMISLAQEIKHSQTQSMAVATSLLKLVDQIETEEVNLDKIGDAYEADLSEHRNAILSLLSIIKTELPKLLHDQNLLGHSERRNRTIRLEAGRIALGQSKGPVIAAGSTGTIPATRALLRAIAEQPSGAVILPGLDLNLDDETWQTIKPDHPQFALKTMLGEFGLARSEVINLNTGNQERNFLASELMRPTETADQWSKILEANKSKIAAATENLKMIEAPDRHLEARSIALILRNVIEKPDQTAALVTPDRDLAGRVRAELRRWNIEIEDSAGEPLTHSGKAALSQRLIEAFSSDFSPASILSLARHPLCDFGLDRKDMLQTLNNLEIAVFRNYGSSNLQSAFERARLAFLNKQRVHPLVSRLDETDWQSMQSLVARIVKMSTDFQLHEEAPFQNQLQKFLDCLNTCASEQTSDAILNLGFEKIIAAIEQDAHRLSPCSIVDAMAVILNVLSKQSVEQSSGSHPRLAIYGLLEARMMPCDVLILGGLNETKWPAQPDPGPWLNRPMRNIFGLQQPEREIGVAAHDFAQGLGYSEVYLTWSKRVDAAPLIPSRWILRLNAVLGAAGLSPKDRADQSWVEWAKAIDEPETLRPVEKPKPSPLIQTRPNRISVTEVEKLIRDPYAIYARRILKLEPLPPLSKQPDAALRGTVFHNAINEWNRVQPELLAANTFEILLKSGEQAFSPYIDDTEIASFWWPRFVRMANWLSNAESQYRTDVTSVETEIFGSVEFDILKEKYTLYGTADRIDFFENGNARFIDYKTGSPPSKRQVTIGLNPQLPLEAAILKYGKFGKRSGIEVASLDYIQVSGGKEAGELTSVTPGKGQSIAELVDQKFIDLKKLLTSYQNSVQPYLPRVAPFKEEGELDYDHLSRFREWMLAGGKL